MLTFATFIRPSDMRRRGFRYFSVGRQWLASASLRMASFSSRGVRAYDPRARQVLTDVAFCQNALSLRGRLCADDRHRMDALRALDLARIKMR